MRVLIFLFLHLFFILLKFQGKNMATNGIKFSTDYGKIICFSLKKFDYFCYILRGICWKKRSARFCEASVQKDFFWHSGTEMVYSKAFKCGIMALSTIAVPFALAEGLKPRWQFQRTSYSASSVVLSKLLLSKTINHSPSITVPTIVLDRYSWSCGLVLCILQFQAILASLGRNPFV